MSDAELAALPLVVDIQTAGRAWGLSRSRVYEAHAAGQLPFPVVTIGGRMKVTRAALLRSLGQIEVPIGEGLDHAALAARLEEFWQRRTSSADERPADQQ